jgi:hypothetical protein
VMAYVKQRLWQEPTYACLADGGDVVFTLQHEGKTGKDRHSFILCALAPKTGKVLARTSHTLPAGLDIPVRAVSAAIPWQAGGLFLLGGTDVAGVIHVSLVKGQLRASSDDPIGLAGAAMLSAPLDPASASVVVCQREQGQIIALRGPGPAHQIRTKPEGLRHFGLWATVVEPGDVLLVMGETSSGRVLSVYDMKRKQWRKSIPCPWGIDETAAVNAGPNKVAVEAADEEYEGCILLIDHQAGTISACPGVGFDTSEQTGPALFVHKGDVVFTTWELELPGNQFLRTVLKASPAGGKPSIVAREQFKGRGTNTVGVLLSSRDGYWLGAPRWILYRKWGSDSPSKHTRCK